MSRPLKTGRVIGRMRQRAQNRCIAEMIKRNEAARLDALLSPYNTAAYRKFTDDRIALYNQLAAFAGTQAVAQQQTQNPLETLHSRLSEASVSTSVQDSPQQPGAAENQATPRKGFLARLAAWLRVRRPASKGHL